MRNVRVFFCFVFFVLDIAKLLLTLIISWQCKKKLSSSLGLKQNLNLSSSFLFFCFFCLQKHYQATLGVNSNSVVHEELKLKLGSHFRLVIKLVFFFFGCKHYQATLGIENNSMMQFEPEFQLGVFVFSFFYFLIFISIAELFLAPRVD